MNFDDIRHMKMRRTMTWLMVGVGIILAVRIVIWLFILNTEGPVLKVQYQECSLDDAGLDITCVKGAKFLDSSSCEEYRNLRSGTDAGKLKVGRCK